jgi:hypothetical protein
VATAWLLAASGVLVWARRRVANCGCFGLRQRLGVGVAVRNGTSIVVAATATIMAQPVGQAAVELLLVASVGGIAVVVWREAAERRGVVV